MQPLIRQSIIYCKIGILFSDEYKNFFWFWSILKFDWLSTERSIHLRFFAKNPNIFFKLNSFSFSWAMLFCYLTWTRADQRKHRKHERIHTFDAVVLCQQQLVQNTRWLFQSDGHWQWPWLTKTHVRPHAAAQVFAKHWRMCQCYANECTAVKLESTYLLSH